jgi:hypothetical protein
MGTMQWSVPHSQNTVMVESSAVLLWNPAMNSAIRSLTSRRMLRHLFDCHLRPFQCESVVAARQPIEISLWSQCNTAGRQKGVETTQSTPDF